MSGLINQVGARSGIISGGSATSAGTVTLSGTTGLDYEEGTWTPTVIGTSSAGTADYTAQEGKYIKIGKQVTLWGYVMWNNGTGTGNLAIIGIPFINSGDHFAHGSPQWNDDISYPADGKDAHWVTNGTTSFYIRCNKDNATFGYVPYSATGEYLRICLTYIAG